MKRGVKKQNAITGSIRVISGKWRGRKLAVLEAQGLRPTTDRMKETLFNWLMPYVHESRCLDMFAGSGSLGFEALSRHATSATFIELDKMAAKVISSNLERLQVSEQQTQVIQGNSLEVCNRLSDNFDLIFIDPPFNAGLVPKAIDAISINNLATTDSIIYIECETQNQGYSVPENWQCIKEKSTQSVSSKLFKVN
ncbi:16S rRNA (guanine(966)-N(2))-methyltransferase RsmD [Aliiglaciecola sp. 3_MG-2023]|uniref:16S rRNA (guanine(966)-N(2))-methyltransferase RsmD n=1 Tax=Aliiglaciecola sp. 3_MG-2023 TaxID=3062644 RepID=UPI0026E2792B|nr:16S rRNA (guanine(966)-N(2))-methyltransferase RsmD [Aliiglaciecola sp. 3_MG-2023]MDO6692372.1 16S rRNA (guanine(966)-N(2))-methyltransferase RsmD [Aliiglaciecola sp. 3_MG-2023]